MSNDQAQTPTGRRKTKKENKKNENNNNDKGYNNINNRYWGNSITASLFDTSNRNFDG